MKCVMESAGRIFDAVFGTPAETVLTVAAVHGSLSDAEAASVVQGVQNQHENKGGSGSTGECQGCRFCTVGRHLPSGQQSRPRVPSFKASQRIAGVGSPFGPSRVEQRH